MKIINYNIYQIAISVISILIIFSRGFKVLKGEQGQTFSKFLLTVFVWLGVLIFALFPDFAQQISKLLGLGDNLNTLIFLVFVVIFLILFKIMNIIEKIESHISEIVREEALKKLKDKSDR